jgi:hypothetical protein
MFFQNFYKFYLIYYTLLREKIPGGGYHNPLQYSCLENPHGQISLVVYSPRGYKESDITEQLSIQHTLLNIYLSEKAGLKLSIQKDHGIRSHHFMPNRWGKKWKQRQIFFPCTPKSLQMVTATMKLKDDISLEERL